MKVGVTWLLFSSIHFSWIPFASHTAPGQSKKPRCNMLPFALKLFGCWPNLSKCWNSFDGIPFWVKWKRFFNLDVVDGFAAHVFHFKRVCASFAVNFHFFTLIFVHISVGQLDGVGSLILEMNPNAHVRKLRISFANQSIQIYWWFSTNGKWMAKQHKLTLKLKPSFLFFLFIAIICTVSRIFIRFFLAFKNIKVKYLRTITSRMRFEAFSLFFVSLHPIVACSYWSWSSFPILIFHILITIVRNDFADKITIHLVW